MLNLPATPSAESAAPCVPAKIESLLVDQLADITPGNRAMIIEGLKALAFAAPFDIKTRDAIVEAIKNDDSDSYTRNVRDFLSQVLMFVDTCE